MTISLVDILYEDSVFANIRDWLFPSELLTGRASGFFAHVIKF